ncbi:hypothetical protein KUL152_30900 [Tenacibaculum sp. KUL152]|uniref:DUF4861 family protein n=1 Tax=Alteromonas sp. KUL106 TaxID=2480799 RepID=UPI0012E4C353|nr:DUF4861 family protein [Alteromonas sp. KUL106]GFD68691.1 hypothetical protein KUL106_19540 [Alteromonas sp. KUL106]GFD90864.1 hypothetical protein KUL152_30900 [Tenacibaculum sp. KUL152]GFD97294.1 hypothetical protein KUL154_60270 [Alteromonas sp. KUL154]GFE01990.1 hypothetical protein KUL156_45820 [Alteromonas sp. KUL156]
MFKHKPIYLAAVVLGLSGITACSSEVQNTVKIDTPTESNQVKAYAKFVPERRDDFAWENDKVAFRVYGPAAPLAGHASGVDAWLKKVDYSIIDKWYDMHFSGQSYHEDRGEGYDPYHTGISRGVGGSAVWINETPYYGHNFTHYEIHENNSDEVKFTLFYKFETPIGMVEEVKKVSLALGSRMYNVHSTFYLNGTPASIPIAIGIATHDEKAAVYKNQQKGWIAAWEEIDNQGLGTAAVIAPDKVGNIIHTPSEKKDESHIWLITQSSAEGELNYQAGFAWEGDREITTVDQWKKYLNSLED